MTLTNNKETRGLCFLVFITNYENLLDKFYIRSFPVPLYHADQKLYFTYQVYLASLSLSLSLYISMIQTKWKTKFNATFDHFVP